MNLYLLVENEERYREVVGVMKCGELHRILSEEDENYYKFLFNQEDVVVIVDYKIDVKPNTTAHQAMVRAGLVWKFVDRICTDTSGQSFFNFNVWARPGLVGVMAREVAGDMEPEKTEGRG